MMRPRSPAPAAPRPHRRAGHLIGLVEARLGASFLSRSQAHPEEDRMWIERSRLLTLLDFLRRDPDADLHLLIDLSALDHGLREPARAVTPPAERRSPVEVFYRLRSPRLGYRVCVSLELIDGDETVPSVTPLFAAAEWLERELWECFGVYPEGHPHLRPLLLYPGFVGHPLRKSYPVDKAQPLTPPRSGTRPPAQPAAAGAPASPPVPPSSRARSAPHKEEV